MIRLAIYLPVIAFLAYNAFCSGPKPPPKTVEIKFGPIAPAPTPAAAPEDSPDAAEPGAESPQPEAKPAPAQ